MSRLSPEESRAIHADRALRRIAAPGRRDGEAQFKELVDMWIDGEDYGPEYDSAVRDWARRSAEVARIVHRVDRERIQLIQRVFSTISASPGWRHTSGPYHVLSPGRLLRAGRAREPVDAAAIEPPCTRWRRQAENFELP